jgi:hypothetical protein
VGGEASLLNDRVGPQTLQQFFSGEHRACGGSTWASGFLASS